MMSVVTFAASPSFPEAVLLVFSKFLNASVVESLSCSIISSAAALAIFGFFGAGALDSTNYNMNTGAGKMANHLRS